jgi:integrase/recombinase XerD
MAIKKQIIDIKSFEDSMCTHLSGNGADLRYIQSLLGHESSKTTEIYTPITTKGFDQIKSQLDKLNIK